MSYERDFPISSGGAPGGDFVQFPQSLGAVAVLAVVMALGATAPADAQEAGGVTGRQVQRAMAQGVAYLRASQLGDGHWPVYGPAPGGSTGLAVTALLTAGLDTRDPTVARGLAALVDTDHKRTYSVAVKAMALAAADPATYRDEIQRCVDDLVRWQNQDGTWTYGDPQRFNRLARGDNSNTQFALLGLYEAAKAGARVPGGVFDLADRHFRRTMSDNGGWTYVGSTGSRTGTMTAAAVASLYITGGRVHTSRERGYIDGAAPECGRYAADIHIAAGLDWLGRNFSVINPPGGQRGQLFYWMYAFERVGVLTGQRYIGGVDWFREGATRLVMLQSPDGSWPALEWNKSINTALAVLFLAKGRLPVLINKLRYDGEWNPDHDDIRNLCAFANANKVFTEPVGWQVVSIDAPLAHWFEAPLVYLNGHEWPALTPAQIERLKGYLEGGGTLMVEACCSRPAFDAGFRRFVAEHLPQYSLNRLDATHPVYHSHYNFADNPPVLFGVDLSCRTSIIYAARDMSCLWQQQAIRDPDEPLRAATVRAFQLGANIAAYAAGREPLPDRLAEVRLPGGRSGSTAEPDPVPRGAIKIAQVRHTGDWRPCARAMPNLAQLLRDKAGVDVADRTEALSLTDRDLFAQPILFMTGHTRFELTDIEKTQLKRYLERGGLLFAEACCGRVAFDDSMRLLLRELFADRDGQPALQRLNADHPLIRGHDPQTNTGSGFDVRRIRYRPAALRDDPKRNAPELWAIAIDGRLAVVYSPFSLGCGLDGMVCNGCRGVEADDARKVAMNIILYALTR